MHCFAEITYNAQGVKCDTRVFCRELFALCIRYHFIYYWLLSRISYYTWVAAAMVVIIMVASWITCFFFVCVLLWSVKNILLWVVTWIHDFVSLRSSEVWQIWKLATIPNKSNRPKLNGYLFHFFRVSRQ